MKKYFIAGLMLGIMAGCTRNKPSNDFVINGNIKGTGNGLVKLIRAVDSNRTSKVIDSVEVKNGTFELKGKMDNPELMTLLITPGNWGMQLFVENAKIKVEGDTTGAEHYDYTAYGMDKGANLNKFRVIGSKTQDEYQQFENHPEQLKFKVAFAELNKTKGADHEALRAKTDSLGKLYKAWQWQYINDFVTKNPSSVAGVYMFSNYYLMDSGMLLADAETMLARFTAGAKASGYYAGLSKQFDKRKRVSPGSKAPDFTLLKRDSTAFTLSSLKGKYVMIDFWASWCKPCREAIPHWKQVYQKYKSKGFEIVSVSDDSNWKDWFKAMDQEKMPWTQVCDEFPVKNMPARVGTLYQTPSLPCYVLLDKNGKILLHTINEKEIDDKLAGKFL